jgi:hypothetical protein
MNPRASQPARPQDLDLPLPVSFPPGTSPFSIRGITLTGYLEFIGEHVPGGLEAAIRALPPPLQPFFRGTFVASGWYDFLPGRVLCGVAARAAGLPQSKFLELFADWQSTKNTVGVNRLILHAGSIEKVALRMGSTYSQHFNFGHITTASHHPGTTLSTIRGMPRFLYEWYRFGIDRSALTILRLAGAKDVQSEMLPPQPDGEMGGAKLVRFEVQRSWR